MSGTLLKKKKEKQKRINFFKLDKLKHELVVTVRQNISLLYALLPQTVICTTLTRN